LRRVLAPHGERVQLRGVFPEHVIEALGRVLPDEMAQK
jgi:hypothetical protein